MSSFGSRVPLYPTPTEPRLLAPSTISDCLVVGTDGPDPYQKSSRLSRTAKILDALAHATVSDKEVIAVAAAPPSSIQQKKWTLFFAGNDPISNETQAYLRRLFALLQSLARVHIPTTDAVEPLQDSPLMKAAKESEQVKGINRSTSASDPLLIPVA